MPLLYYVYDVLFLGDDTDQRQQPAVALVLTWVRSEESECRMCSRSSRMECGLIKKNIKKKKTIVIGIESFFFIRLIRIVFLFLSLDSFL